MTIVIHRKPALRTILGSADSTIYLHVSQGILPKPINLSPRSVGWPAPEIDAILAARIAGKTEDDIKSLVASLMAARKNAS
jgi:prophage regulatory protein